MYRKHSHVIFIVTGIYIWLILFTKGYINDNSLYTVVNGQLFRYFIYTIMFCINLILIPYNIFESNTYIRIKDNLLYHMYINYGVVIYINIAATLIAGLSYIIYNGSYFSLLELLITIVSALLYQIFLVVIFLNVYFVTKLQILSSGITFLVIYFLNDALFVRVEFYDDLWIFGFVILLTVALTRRVRYVQIFGF